MAFNPAAGPCRLRDGSPDSWPEFNRSGQGKIKKRMVKKMSEYITLELDSDVMANIKKRADELGISEYDLLRYEIGAMHPNIKPLPLLGGARC